MEDIKKEIRQFIELDDSASSTYQNIWEAMNAVLRRKRMAVNGHIGKTVIPNKQANDEPQGPRETSTLQIQRE